MEVPMWTLPSGYKTFGQANNGQQLIAHKATSTAAKPVMLIVDRQEAVYNAQSKTFSNPGYRIRIIQGTVDVDGNPLQPRLLADCNFRTPVGSEDDHAELFADLMAVLGSDGFLTDGVQGHYLPEDAAAA